MGLRDASDIRIFNSNIIKNAIEEHANMRIIRSKLSLGKYRITKIKNKHENTILEIRIC